MSELKIKKVLIANRGEIALRIINACQELGIQTVAVYSESDKNSMHALSADEAYFIGPSPASESYLIGEKILQVAKDSGCDSIHPGYGFLAENGDFAEEAEKAGLKYIGPPPSAIRSMGSKTNARQIMIAAEVPVVPGTAEAVPDAKAAVKIAEEIGYPVLIKASGGGGGKGMRRVNSPDDLEDGFNRAVSEAQSAFGNPEVYIERFVENPRHIEFQVMADEHGNIVHLGERECSIQRRHQKVIEEAPSPTVTEEERMRVGEIAVQAAKACSYTSAGTVEFLMDSQRNFFFLEMNTRIQVEHPVTEEVTKIDIVKEQFNIASGNKLSFEQKDITWTGHAIECRIYAEDPLNDFYPSIGFINEFQEPSGNGIRIESGIKCGSEISVFYDPMVAKLICYASDREGAINRSKQALKDYLIRGVKTNTAFCEYVLNHPKFISGDFDTNFVANEYSPEELKKLTLDEKALLAAVGALYKHEQLQKSNGNGKKEYEAKSGNWKTIGLARNI